MDRKLIESIVDDVVEGWSERDHPRGKGGKFESKDRVGGDIYVVRTHAKADEQTKALWKLKAKVKKRREERARSKRDAGANPTGA